MRQSIGLVILQIFGIVLGLVSVFWVAGSLPPEEYAIVGIYNIISTLILVFSNTGIETHAIRNVLAWKEEGKIDQLKLTVTQSITYRTIFASIVFLPIIGYSAYISTHKFNGQYFGLFILMGFLSISKATNDATVLILRSFNKYLAAALVTYTVNVFGKIVALLLFIKYGFLIYIYMIMLLPLITTIPVLLMIKDNIDFKGVFKWSNFKTGVVESKYFAFSSYISYIFNFLDQLLVSIFMSAEILGTFSVAKNILSMAKTFIENIFDPMIQNLVSVKQNMEVFKLKLKRVFKIRNILLYVSILFIPLVYFTIGNILNILQINHYPFLNYFIVFIYLSQVVHIAMKVKYNYICLFYPQSSYLKINTINALLMLLFFVVIVLIDAKLLFLHLLLANIFMYFYSEKQYNNKNNPLNNEICS